MTVALETTDLETIHQVLGSIYHSVRLRARSGPPVMRLAQQTFGPLRLERVSFRMDFDGDAAPLGQLTFCQFTHGAIGHDSGGSERRYTAGDVFLAAQPEHPCTAHIRDSDGELATIDPVLLGQVADMAPTRRPAPVRFLDYRPSSPAAAAIWNDTFAYVRDALADPAVTDKPLLVGTASRLLVATALTTFPNNALTDPTIEDRHDASTTTLRRAVTFIDEHSHLDISVADIAAAAHVTIRAVQLAFRRHLDTTPTSYLRHVRLHHAHRDLINANPTTTTIAAVAARWGFSHHSRFAALHRVTYGVTPSHTLHH